MSIRFTVSSLFFVQTKERKKILKSYEFKFPGLNIAKKLKLQKAGKTAV